MKKPRDLRQLYCLLFKQRFFCLLKSVVKVQRFQTELHAGQTAESGRLRAIVATHQGFSQTRGTAQEQHHRLHQEDLHPQELQREHQKAHQALTPPQAFMYKDSSSLRNHVLDLRQELHSFHKCKVSMQ